MGKIIDVEEIVYKLAAHAKATFNTKVTSINNEKNDGISLAPVAEGAWFFQSLDDGNHNFDPFILFFIDNMTAKGAGKALARNVSLEFDIFMVNDYTDDLQKKILRYQRVLEETLMTAWDKVDPFCDIEMQSLTPIDIKMQNNSTVYKVFGAIINFEIA